MIDSDLSKNDIAFILSEFPKKLLTDYKNSRCLDTKVLIDDVENLLDDLFLSISIFGGD